MGSLQCEKPTIENDQPQAYGEPTKPSAALKIKEIALHVMKANQKTQDQTNRQVANHSQCVVDESQFVESKTHESVVVQDGKIKTTTTEKKKKDKKEKKEASMAIHSATYDGTNTVISGSVKAGKKTKDEKKKEKKEKKKKKEEKKSKRKLDNSSSSSSSSEGEDDTYGKKKGGNKYK